MVAAVRWPDGRVTTGVTHFFAYGEVAYEDMDPETLEKTVQGFQADDGRFLTRDEAHRKVFGEDGSLCTGDYL